MRRTPILAVFLACASLSSCGGGEAERLTREGRAALDSGDPAKALVDFRRAASRLAPDAPHYLEAKVGEVRALARCEPGRAVQELLALAKERALPAGVYKCLAVDLVLVEAFLQAVEVLDAGNRAHPDYPGWQELIQRVGDEARIRSEGSAPSRDRRIVGLGSDVPV